MENLVEHFSLEKLVPNFVEITDSQILVVYVHSLVIVGKLGEC